MSPRRVWHLLREPRAQTAIAAVMWIICTTTGVAALVAPPISITSEIGPILTTIWGLFLGGGGVVGLVGCLLLPQPWWRVVEQVGLVCAATGLSIYGAMAVHAQLTTGGSRLVQILVIALAATSLVARGAHIHSHRPTHSQLLGAPDGHP